ncbi:two-component regulator propeller domain-containing protein [Mangrovibacterium sp.]|uniref:hybrid sensor histidine kinase/response regulator transcription factor n=1 Tax=Mangrovibacterium sp. TaxID=1961364 RepID=UPI003562D897
MIRLFFVLLFLILQSLAQAQSYSQLYFERIDSDYKGLISDVVNSIYQDSNGFMWFSTDEGIARYDGYEFRSFKTDPQLGLFYGVQINKIVSDNEDRIFICTNHGFYAYTKAFEPTMQFAVDLLDKKGIVDCLTARNGKIYVSTDEILYELDPVAQTANILTLEDGRTNIVPKQIVEDSKGRIWVGSWERGLLLLRPESKKLTSYKLFERTSPIGTTNSVNSLFIDSQGYLWAGTWGCGLHVLDVSSDSAVNVIKSFTYHPEDSNSIPGDIIHVIREDINNTIWIGTPYGLAAIRYPLTRKHQISHYTTSNNKDISSNIIKDIFRDRSDLLWIATKGGGAMKLNLDQKKFVTKQIPELDQQIRTQAVHAFEIDKKGRLLLGVLSLGFVVYDFKSQQFSHYKDVPEYRKIADEFDLNTVNSFLWDQDSVLWMGTRYNGLVQVNPKTGEIKYINNNTTQRAFKGREVNVLYLEKNGDIYAGTELGINRISHHGNGEFKIRYIDFLNFIPKTSARGAVTGIVSYDNHRLLVSTESAGLFMLELNKGETEVTHWSKEEAPLKIITLFKDSNDRIWIGTKGQGVFYIDKATEKFVSPHPVQFISGDIVYGINQDSYGNIWITTNHGLARFSLNNPETADRYFYRNGLQGNIFISRSFFNDKSGRFYVGGHNGFNIFDPLHITKGNDPFNVVVTDVFVDGQRYPYVQGVTKKIEIDHTHNDFSTVFSSLSYLFPDANQYAYRVDGIDKDWKYVNAQMRGANYSNLEPGTYTLRVRGSNSQGVWSAEEEVLDIVVRPNPFFTWWAYLFYILVILSVFGMVVYFRFKALQIKQKLELEQVEHLKSEKLNQYKLRFFTNISHELLTPISILSSAVEVLNLKKQYLPESVAVMERNINNLNRLIRSLLLFRKLETGNMGIKTEETDLSGFVNDAVRDFNLLAAKKKIDFNLQIQPDLKGKTDREKLEMILHNLLSNAFRFTPEGGNVSVSLKTASLNEKMFEIGVKDSGIGISRDALPNLFNRFYRVANEKSSPGIGIGLNLTKSLVDALGGSIQVESIEGEGTGFIISLPIYSSGDDTSINEMNSILPEEIMEIPGNEEENETGYDHFLSEDGSRSKPAILLAEDNDDFRKTLRVALSEYFIVHEAADGQAALEIAREKDIDLIISDVRMPLLSGRELCRKIKSDIQFSHIPVILLTARVGEEQKLAGYEAGADAYLEKPVQIKLLMLRIQVLLKQRQAIMRQFKSNQIFEPENVSITPLDEDFILKAKSIVEKYIGDADFSVKLLAEELNASSSMLYRKMRTLIGVSPNEFIRNIRLRRAAQLLKNKAFTVSEVAYNCGFNDLSYFGSCFKKMYGVTPTAYQTGDRLTPEK